MEIAQLCGFVTAAILLGFLAVGAGGGLPDLPFGAGAWESKPRGNHRARLRVGTRAPAVRAHILWRRRDPDPEAKNILVFDAATGEQVTNVVRVEVNREFGEIIFEPPTVPGEYHVYYMPWTDEPVPWAYVTRYEPPEDTADAAWVQSNGLTPEALREGKWRDLPQADVLEIQARSEFDRFDPMEIIATAEETAQLLAQHPGLLYLLFVEDREHAIRMTDDLPLRWVRRGPDDAFRGEARRGEFYAFQVGVWAAREPVEDIAVEFADLTSSSGTTIPADAFRCVNLGGTDWLGRPFAKAVPVPAGKVQALWFGVQVPTDASPGEYRGTLMVRPGGGPPTPVAVELSVSEEVVDDAGDSNPYLMSRLRWLDSTLGVDDDVVAPYTPLEVDGSTVRCLGRQVRFGATGLPESIVSNFTWRGRTGPADQGEEILARPLGLVVETSQGQVSWAGGGARATKQTPGAVTLQAESAGGPLTMRCSCKMEFDGHIDIRLTLKASEAVNASDIRLEIPLRREVATYMMGLGHKGGYRRRDWQWVWDLDRANNMVWVGDVRAGLHCTLKGPTDTWEMGDLHASGIPESWGNSGQGGCTVVEDGDEVLIRAYSGARRLEPGDELEFRFALLITPVKALDPAHWSQRYCDGFPVGLPPAVAVERMVTVSNVHHGTELNPYINYPFLRAAKLAAYTREAHEYGIRAKIYYTVREVSNRVAELWALRSLGDEVFASGTGGGHSWLLEHLATGYVPDWHQPLPDETDASIATAALSRWHNYYLEGLRWLLQNVQIDGIYLDGIGYDREIMKRVRKVLDRTRPGCLMDFHNGNAFLAMDLRVSPACRYMEHFPYINSLWFGEGYDYDESPDYWLVEVSGIPYGLFGDILEGGGNAWRGMVYGMTGRYYKEMADPKHIWQLWDDFGIQDAEMIGYWDPDCPVRADREDVLATVYRRQGKALVAIASWADGDVECGLLIDWQGLGLDAQRSRFHAPAIPGFQPEARFGPTDSIPLPAGRGWLLIIGEQADEADA